MSAHSGEERLGPYRLREQLGEGGMGVVYLASDPGDRPVAVKVLRQGIPSEATARRRLAREVDTMRRVHSPNVAEVVDADVEGNPPYIVTRYASGRSLEDLVAADGPLTGQALADLARGLAAALVAIHAAGVVHRDLKPGNVMMVEGQPVVIDFGISQSPDSTRLTMTGMFMGTPGYLAPEVIEGRPSGPAADVHSWAATMAYAATGRPPFGTGQFEAIFYRIVHGQPELERMPAPLLPIVLAGLARDPSRRPSAADLADLASLLNPPALVPAPAALLPGGVAASQPGQLSRTAQDLPAQPGLINGPAALTGASLPWPGTRPIAVQSRDDFGDLLTPVRYDQAGRTAGALAGPRAGFAAAPAGAGMPGQVAPGNGWAPPPPWPPSPVPAGSGAGQPGPYGLPGQQAGPGQPAAAPPARLPLVLATMAGLIAIGVLLPVAGVVAVLCLLILLRAADRTTGWLARRRGKQGPRRSDSFSAAFFYPWAVGRSALGLLLLAPLAALCAAAAGVATVLALGPDQLGRAGANAAGALLACYCVGPGSRACRRPLSRIYGRITRSAPTAIIGTLGLTALAVAAIAAAITLTPGYWPAEHLGDQLQGATVAPLHHLSGNVAEVGRRIIRWLGQRL